MPDSKTTDPTADFPPDWLKQQIQKATSRLEPGSKMTKPEARAFIRLPNGERLLSLPEPFAWGLLPWLWKRLTGWRDAYGRPAQFIGWRG